MKIFVPRVFLWLALIILSPGCATENLRPEVSTHCDAQFLPTPTSKIALTLRPDPNPEDAELGRLLTAELQRENFNLVPAEQSDYLLTYVVDNIAEEKEWGRIHQDDLTQSMPSHSSDLRNSRHFPRKRPGKSLIHRMQRHCRPYIRMLKSQPQNMFSTRKISACIFTRIQKRIREIFRWRGREASRLGNR